MKKVLRFVAGVLFVTMITAGYLFEQNNLLSVTKQIIKDDELPESFSGMKIAHISDIHNFHSDILLSQIVNKLNKEKPDYIFITGDSLDGNMPDYDELEKILKAIGKCGHTYVITGNHDDHCRKAENFGEFMANCGVTLLDNANVRIKHDDGSINIIGMNNVSENKTKNMTQFEVFLNAFKKVDYKKEEFTILLSHKPDLFSAYIETESDLVLCGHVHGGQARIPFVGGVYGPGQGMWPQYDAGLYTEGETTMYVSRGLGNSRFPFRINNRPELIFLTLQNK